ncbi:hypothetical protein PFICI_00761 [Pestalotiopsis fici W106-1]|uniref:Uncharacterized protein n=1 Tax=Pestalotiopsis fici (strain W106-1 / CGMCC3.15140) TaxID=1229662 RepID=W3XLI9_PESFW|nr:uncharacterized protein PFICI_00761 [Pestalotiopsis fici W106-1]ETS86933.1 hypothetical protein PFICI_00761 [Pestalotiopsis fici W106-1]
MKAWSVTTAPGGKVELEGTTVEVEVETDTLVVDDNVTVVLESSVVRLEELEEGVTVVLIGKTAVPLVLLLLMMEVDSNVGLIDKLEDELDELVGERVRLLVESKIGLINELKEGVTVTSVGKSTELLGDDVERVINVGDSVLETLVNEREGKEGDKREDNESMDDELEVDRSVKAAEIIEEDEESIDDEVEVDESVKVAEMIAPSLVEAVASVRLPEITGYGTLVDSMTGLELARYAV